MQQTLQVPQQSPLDQHWFDRLDRIAGTAAEVYMVLGPSAGRLEEARRQFLESGGKRLPGLRPEDPEPAPYAAHMGQLTELRDMILAGEPNELVQEAYVRRIDELIANNLLFIAAAKGDYDEFAYQNRELYGAPDRAVFQDACAWIRDEALSAQDSGNVQTASAAAKVRSEIPDLGGRPAGLLPNVENFERARALHHRPGGYFDQLFAGIELPRGHVTRETGDPMLRRALANVGSGYAIADSPNHLWGVYHARHSVIRPAQYRLRPGEFAALVAHEIGSHLLERVNGLRQPLRLLGIGLDHYERGNEGRALLREQLIYPDLRRYLREPDWQDTVMKHVAICLAAGLSARPYNFAEVYSAVFPVYAMWEHAKHRDAQTAEAIAHDRTWNTVTRVHRGTGGRGGTRGRGGGQGGAYLKDIVYLEGNIACWRAAEHDPAAILRGDLGKYDIANPGHLALIGALDI